MAHAVLTRFWFMDKTRILVVDDDPQLSEIVRVILEKTQRFEIRVENRSSQAVAAAIEFRPALILLDVDMPGKDGGDVAREIRATAALRSVEIVFLTSLVSRAEAGEGVISRGGERFLPKPVNSKVLIEVIDRALQTTPAAA